MYESYTFHSLFYLYAPIITLPTLYFITFLALYYLLYLLPYHNAYDCGIIVMMLLEVVGLCLAYITKIA